MAGAHGAKVLGAVVPEKDAEEGSDNAGQRRLQDQITHETKVVFRSKLCSSQYLTCSMICSESDASICVLWESNMGFFRRGFLLLFRGRCA